MEFTIRSNMSSEHIHLLIFESEIDYEILSNKEVSTVWINCRRKVFAECLFQLIMEVK